MMREFFGGWRRTVGCVAMVMAMLLADAWLLSIDRSDSVEFHLLGQLNVIKSHQQHLDWFVIANSSWTYGRVWHIPYAALTIPATLLSAGLLFWPTKRRTNEAHLPTN